METVIRMLSVFQGWNLYIREFGNGIVFSLCFVLAFVLGGFIWRTYSAIGTLAAFRRADGSTTACVLWWLLMLEGMRAFCAYVPLDAANAGVRLSDNVRNAVSFGFALSVCLLVIVLIRAVFLFQAPQRIAATLVAAVLTVAAVLWWRELFQLFT